MPQVFGPLGKSTEDLALWLKTVTNVEYYKNNPDPYVKIIPFDT